MTLVHPLVELQVDHRLDSEGFHDFQIISFAELPAKPFLRRFVVGVRGVLPMSRISAIITLSGSMDRSM